MLQFCFLSEKFYLDYKDCPEIEQKQKRPYIQVQVLIDGVLFGIPLRSNIKHQHVLWTDKQNRCGVDFSKTVVIADPDNYINKTENPYIRPHEFNALRGKEFIIQQRLKKYISDYKKAKEKPDLERNKTLLQYSTLQYFEEYI